MLTTVPARAEDESFLSQVFAATRGAQFSALGWPEAQLNAFLQLQFSIQQRSYAMQFPEADCRIIRYDDRPVGRVIVYRSDSEVRLVDIAVLPAYQSRGIGVEVIRSLQAEATREGKPLTLQVLKGNPARRLYDRLGFVETGENGTHHAMEWRNRLIKEESL